MVCNMIGIYIHVIRNVRRAHVLFCIELAYFAWKRTFVDLKPSLLKALSRLHQSVLRGVNLSSITVSSSLGMCARAAIGILLKCKLFTNSLVT